MSSITAGRDPPKNTVTRENRNYEIGATTMPTATKTPSRPLTELERAEQEVEQAAQRAEVARQRAEAAAEAARQRQEERQKIWADLEIAANPGRIREHAQTVGERRLAFEKAAIDDPTQAIKTFVGWTSALASQHAAQASVDFAMGILGRVGRVPEWPRLSFAAELDGVLERHAGDQLDAATEAERERRSIAFNGTGDE